MSVPVRATISVRTTTAVRGILAVAMTLCAWHVGYGAAPATEDVPPAPKTLRVVKAATAPIIDGKLDDEVWKTAATIDELHQIRPGNGTPPTERTIVYVLYDKDALYVAARMWDSGAPGEVTR